MTAPYFSRIFFTEAAQNGRGDCGCMITYSTEWQTRHCPLASSAPCPTLKTAVSAGNSIFTGTAKAEEQQTTQIQHQRTKGKRANAKVGKGALPPGLRFAPAHFLTC